MRPLFQGGLLLTHLLPAQGQEQLCRDAASVGDPQTSCSPQNAVRLCLSVASTAKPCLPTPCAPILLLLPSALVLINRCSAADEASAGCSPC